MSKRKVVVDIDTDFVNVTESLIAGNKVIIEKSFSIPSKSEWFINKEISQMKNLVEAIAHEMEIKKIRTRRITLMFPSDSVKFRIKKAYKLTSVQEMQFAKGQYIDMLGVQSNVNDIDLTHVKSHTLLGNVISETEMYNSFSFACISKTILESLIDSFKSKGLKVNEVCVHEMSAEYFSKLVGGFTFEDDCRAYIGIGKYETRLAIVHKDVLVYTRTIEYGTENLMQSILVNADISPEYEDIAISNLGYSLDIVRDYYDEYEIMQEIENRLMDDHIDIGCSVRDYYDMASKIMKEYLDEVNKTFMGFEDEFHTRVKSIYLYGAGIDNLGIHDSFREYFNDKSIYGWHNRVNVDTQFGIGNINNSDMKQSLMSGLWTRNKKLRDVEISTVMGSNAKNKIDVVNSTDNVLAPVYFNCLAQTIKDCNSVLPKMNLVPNSARLSQLGSFAKIGLACCISLEVIVAGVLYLSYYNKENTVENLQAQASEVSSLNSKITANNDIITEKNNIIDAINFGSSNFPLYELINSIATADSRIVISSIDTEDSIIAVEGTDKTITVDDGTGTDTYIEVPYAGSNKVIIVRGYAKDADVVASMVREIETQSFVATAELDDIGKRYTEELQDAYVFQATITIY